MDLFSLRGETDLTVEYAPIIWQESEVLAKLPPLDYARIKALLKELAAASRHRRALVAEDAPAESTRGLKYTIVPFVEAVPRPYYQVIVTYPLTLAMTFVDWSKIFGKAPDFLDAHHCIGPAYDKAHDCMTVELRVMAASNGPRSEEVMSLTYWRTTEYAIAVPFQAPEGVGLRRVGSAPHSPLTPTRKRPRVAPGPVRRAIAMLAGTPTTVATPETEDVSMQEGE